MLAAIIFLPTAIALLVLLGYAVEKVCDTY